MSDQAPFQSSESKIDLNLYKQYKQTNHPSSQDSLIPYPFRVACVFMVGLWVAFFISRLPMPFIQDIFRLGIVPRHPIGLLGIFTAPWVHADFNHLLSNQGVLLHLVFLSWLKPNKEILVVFILIISTGLGVWLLGMNGNHIGASGLVFALQGFNVFTAFYQRRWVVLIALVGLILLENSFLYGVLGWLTFDHSHISYSSHISGLVSGIFWAGIYRRRE